MKAPTPSSHHTHRLCVVFDASDEANVMERLYFVRGWQRIEERRGLSALPAPKDVDAYVVERRWVDRDKFSEFEAMYRATGKRFPGKVGVVLFS